MSPRTSPALLVLAALASPALASPALGFAGDGASVGGAAPPALHNVKVNDPLVAGGDVAVTFLISPNGRRVYQADQEQDGRQEMYSVRADGVGGATKLSDALVPGGGVGYVGTPFQLTADGSRVVYKADADQVNDGELYSVPIDGSTEPVELNDPLPASGDVVNFQLSPDSSRAVYLADQDVNSQFELYSVPLDGSEGPTQLNEEPVALGGAVTYAISTDSTRVVYVGDQDTNDVYEIYSVPLDGSATAVKLNDELAAGGDVDFDFAIAPDGSRAVYVADQDMDELFEIYSVPLDGSESPTKLNGLLVFQGDVSTNTLFQISPDSSRVIYAAGQSIDNVVELFSVPIDGSQFATRLNDLENNSWENITFRIMPDSSRVVFRSDEDAFNVYELYSVPLAGGQTPTKLSGSLVQNGDVEWDYVLSADSNWVVYRADQDTNHVFELYAAPVDGSQAARKLSAPLVAGGDVGQRFFGVGPNSRFVVYGADQQTDERDELYVVPIDGSRRPKKLNGALAPGGNVGAEFVRTNFRFTPDGRGVVYRAEQDADEVFELYSSTLTPRPAGVGSWIP